jgi:hypothetical protein
MGTGFSAADTAKSEAIGHSLPEVMKAFGDMALTWTLAGMAVQRSWPISTVNRAQVEEAPGSTAAPDYGSSGFYITERPDQRLRVAAAKLGTGKVILGERPLTLSIWMAFLLRRVVPAWAAELDPKPVG